MNFFISEIEGRGRRLETVGEFSEAVANVDDLNPLPSKLPLHESMMLLVRSLMMLIIYLFEGWCSDYSASQKIFLILRF